MELSTFRLPKVILLLLLPPPKLSRGVTGNTLDFDSRKSRFEPWRDNLLKARFIFQGILLLHLFQGEKFIPMSEANIGKPWRDNLLKARFIFLEFFPRETVSELRTPRS